MDAYEPLDLSATCNAGMEFLGAQRRAPVGIQSFHGLPFQIGDADGAVKNCFIAFGSGYQEGALRIPIEKSVRNIVVAHRLMGSEIMNNGPLAESVAEYIFHLEGGETVSAPIRERFEISTVPNAGGAPFRSFQDQKDSLQPRFEGPWGNAGRRQMEANRANARGYVLWVWENPSPEKTVESLEVIPTGSSFLIAAITLGHANEYPISRQPLKEMVITLPQQADGEKPFNVDVEVDRGVVTYPYALPEQDSEAFINDRTKGWGEPQNPKSSPAYVEVAATPSAMVTVKQEKEILGEVNWGELQEKGELEVSPRLKVSVVNRGKNWVHTNVVDDKTGKPVPCRVHFRSPEGIPYAPHGHHAHVNSNMGTWHLDVKGDVRLGQISYAYIDGTCQGWLPKGEVIVDVARGFEYEPLRQRIEIKPGQRELELRLKRWCSMNEDGWYSGDSHVHFLSTQGSHTEAQNKDLNVVNLLPSQWGSLFTNMEEFTGRASVSPDGKSIVYVGSENRQHMLGHLILMGLKETVMPWCSDGSGEAELGGTLEVTMSDWADQCHSQGGTVVIPHLPSPNGEPATLIATGRADAIEMLRHGMYNHNEYYRYLNCGYKLPLVGGTDKMSSDVPVGIYRTYVKIPENEEFTYDNWCKYMAAGRTFHSGGPMIKLSVDGHQVGDTINLPGNGGTVEVRAEAESILPIHSLEVVQEGRVVASTEDSQGTRKLALSAKVKVEGHTWLAARCGGPGYSASVPHLDGWGRGVMAHTSPIYIACGEEWWMFNEDTAKYMLTLVDGCVEYIRHTSRRDREEEVVHHHDEDDHQTYLEKPFVEAREAIHKRMHRFGIPH